jgi:rubredoxin
VADLYSGFSGFYPMPYRVCPKCKNVGRLLSESSSGALEYYRCDRCGHMWIHDKNDLTHQPKPITYIPKKQ